MDPSLTKLLNHSCPVYAYADSKQTKISFPIVFGRFGAMDGAPMRLLKIVDNNTIIFKGTFSDMSEFKLYIEGTRSSDRYIRHRVSLFVGDKFEKRLLGNFYIFDYQ